MEEVIGFGVVGLLVISLVLGVRKLFKKKRDLFDYEDEIILDKKMLHLGPFSGSFVYPHRKSILLLAVSSSFLSASIDNIRTIDDWGMNSFGNNHIVMQKSSEDTESDFWIEMIRPFCICSDPTITTPVGDSRYSEEDRIKATMIVDKEKPKDIVLRVSTILGSGSDKEYVLKLLHFPSLRYKKNFSIKFNHASPLNDMHFSIAGMSNAMKQSEKVCISSYNLKEPEILETSFI